MRTLSEISLAVVSCRSRFDLAVMPSMIYLPINRPTNVRRKRIESYWNRYFSVKSLGRPWMYCAVRTDEGITGYSEFGVGDLAKGLQGLVEDLSRHIIGKDPRSVEQHYTNMVRSSRSAYGGATWMAIAGIELALWDVKGKAMVFPFTSLSVVPRARSRRCTGPTLCPSSQRTTRH